MKPPTQSEIELALYGKRRNKYDARRTNGYASKREANVAAQLQAAFRGGAIFDLREQVRFELVPAIKGARRSEKAIVYVSDFVWKDKQGVQHVGDAKGMRTPVYVIKRKLMKFIYNIEIEEL